MCPFTPCSYDGHNGGWSPALTINKVALSLRRCDRYRGCVWESARGMIEPAAACLQQPLAAAGDRRLLAKAVRTISSLPFLFFVTPCWPSSSTAGQQRL